MTATRAMTSSAGISDSRDIKAIDARASSFMEEGIRLMHSANGADAPLLCFDRALELTSGSPRLPTRCDAALLYFDRALELRRQLPIEVPMHAYGLAACWLNRGEALARLGHAHHAQALRAYDEALALLRPLPLGDDARFSRRLAIAHQDRALVLAAQIPPAVADAIEALTEAIAVLDQAEAMDPPERDYLLAVVWMNLANIQASEATIVSDAAARKAARRALMLLKEYEHEDATAAEAGIKARHVLCRIAARQLSAQAESETVMIDARDATDLVHEGLGLVRKWERRGDDRFRNLASDLFRFGARIYASYRPHVLHEFLDEPPHPRLSSFTAARADNKAARS
jgi:tetratricopeptide (TPR) repeat protein